MRAHIPNLLTSLRVVLAGVFFLILARWTPATPLPALTPALTPDAARHTSLDPALLAATGLFILAAVTDALDGALARRWNAQSAFGRVMDPFADKLLVLGALVFMAGPAFAVHLGPPGHQRPHQLTALHPWMTTLILARELFVTSLRGVLESRGVPFPADLPGKLKMAAQAAGIPLILLLIALGLADPRTGPDHAWARLTITLSAWTILLVTLWSAWPYAARGIAALGAPTPPETHPAERRPRHGAHPPANPPRPSDPTTHARR